jgi:uncharacterized membrane protein/glutaredoxin
VFGLPLSLYGLLAYLAMGALALAPLAVNPETNKALRNKLENWTWPILFAGATAMLVFSAYLMNIMVSKFVVPYGANGICYFCVASALFALGLFILTLLGRSWEDISQLFFIGVIVTVVTLVGSLGVYAQADSQMAGTPSASPGQSSFAIQNTSGAAEIALAKHLKQTGAKMFGAYWCSHCQDQKELFGKEAAAEIPYIECAPDGKNPQTEVCKAAGVQGFPTWQINGKNVESGTQSLQRLAELSNYTGPKEFRNR